MIPLTVAMPVLVALAATLAGLLYVPANGEILFHKLTNLQLPQNPITGKPPFDLLYHLGGHGPWVQKRDGIIKDGIQSPDGCRVDQVHMLSRHAERYPTTLAGIKLLELFQRIQHAKVKLQGDLAFANDWNFFMKDPAIRLDNLVATGTYAGTLRAFSTGVRLRTRYEHLVEDGLARNQTTLWASGSKRVIETAQYFAAGLYGLDWEDRARLQIIPETEALGGDTLTPGNTCFKYKYNADPYGRGYGLRMFEQWREAYLPAIAQRLASENPGFGFTSEEVYSMQELCAFETITNGSSLWCDVFTQREIEEFEYARDLLHFYRTGPGNPYSGAMGWLWLNATSELLLRGPSVGPIFFSFVHDGDILPVITALDLILQIPPLPTASIPNNRTWRTSDIVPMSGRLILERLTCPGPQECWSNGEFGYPNHVYCAPGKDEIFIRLNINDGIVALPGCEDGPGRSCALANFTERVRKRGEEVGDFREVCGLPNGAAKGVGFLHQ